MPAPRLLSAILLALATAAAAHAQNVDLRQQMGEAEFQRSGLGRLSPQELDRLQRWLAAHPTRLAATAPTPDASAAPSAADAAATTPARRDRSTIESHIAGAFSGWSRGTVLTLRNGQQWRVVDDSDLTVTRPLEAPAVTIRPGVLGSWMLKVAGYNTGARVAPAN